jgi:hypothetical protein
MSSAAAAAMMNRVGRSGSGRSSRFGHAREWTVWQRHLDALADLPDFRMEELQKDNNNPAV